MNKAQEKTRDDFWGEVIFTYTRQQAIEDGCQMLLTDEHAEIARQAGWKYPVYLTAGVTSLIEQAVASERHCNDYNGVLWDILWMSRFGKDIAPDTRIFDVIITGAGRKRTHQLYMQVGATDFNDPTPALTIMLPEDL